MAKARNRAHAASRLPLWAIEILHPQPPSSPAADGAVAEAPPDRSDPTVTEVPAPPVEDTDPPEPPLATGPPPLPEVTPPEPPEPAEASLDAAASARAPSEAASSELPASGGATRAAYTVSAILCAPLSPG
jgi:hypothetical protein